MTYQQYKAELLWIQVSTLEVFSSLNSIQRDAICHWDARDWRLITEVVYNPAGSYWNQLAKYPSSIGYPLMCRTVRYSEVEQLFALWQSLKQYRCRLAYWFWTSRLGEPPVFSKEK